MNEKTQVKIITKISDSIFVAFGITGLMCNVAVEHYLVIE